MNGREGIPQISVSAANLLNVIREHWLTVGLTVFGYIVLPVIARQPYYVLQDTARLLLYAILVQILTFDIPIRDFITETLNGAMLLFIYVSVGTVLFGQAVEIGLDTLTGELVAAQFLVLSILGARAFMGFQKYGPTFYNDEPENTKYYVYLPCATAFLLPFVFRELQRGLWLLPRVTLGYPSTQWLVWTIFISTSVSATVWWFVKQYDAPHRVKRRLRF